MSRIVLVAVLTGGAPAAAAQTVDGRDLLLAAAETMRSVRSASYDARLEVRGGQSQRIVIGHVAVVRNLDHSDAIGGHVAVRGEISTSGSTEPESFAAAYDGRTVRRLLDGRKILLQADPGFGGEELLRGSFGALILGDLLAVQPYAEDLKAPKVTSLGQEDVNGEPCDVIEVRHTDPDSTVRWYLTLADRVPRKKERRFRSAGGNEVESVLTLSDVRLNVDIDPGEFRIEVSDDVRVETVGSRPPPPVIVGQIAPDWTLTDGDGRTHTLSEYRGKVVVLDFWASWCPHCRRAMPAMQRLHDTYADRGLALFGVNCRDRGEIDPVAFVRQQGYSYPVIVDGNKLAVQYRVGGIPAFFVIAPDGTLIYNQSGYNEAAEARLEELIRQYLGG